jgi:hypothetical protein
MFTLQVVTKEKNQSEFLELGETFKIISSDSEEEWIKSIKQQHQDVKEFIIGNKYTIPVLNCNEYVIYNSKNEIFKTL